LAIPSTEGFAEVVKLDSTGSKQVIVDPATGDVDFAPLLSRNSWNIFGKRKNGGENGSNLGAISEDTPDPVEWEKQQEKERAEREAAEKKQWEELDTTRLREISSKAVTALFLLLLKWFRVSRWFPPTPFHYSSLTFA